MNMDDIIEAYAQHIVDGMDQQDLVAYATEQLLEALATYSEEDLLAEIRENANHLLEEEP